MEGLDMMKDSSSAIRQIAAPGSTRKPFGSSRILLIFSSKTQYYYIALGLLLLTLLANFLIEKSYLGYYFRAIKDEPDAARSLGVDLGRYKQIAFAISSFFTALGGSLYAQKELYI